MEITIRHTPECPNVVRAEERVRAALAEIGMARTAVRTEAVATPEEAERLGFAGSPTILLDGIDPFAGPVTPAAYACRMYQTPDGPDGAPSVAQIRAALEGS